MPICSFIFCIHLDLHQDLKLKCCRGTGPKLRYGRPCTHDLPGNHNWLAQPHIASISSDLYHLMMTQSWRFKVNCSIGLTHPAACTRARVPRTFTHVPPFYPNCSKRVANKARAEDSDDIFIIVEVAHKIRFIYCLKVYIRSKSVYM